MKGQIKDSCHPLIFLGFLNQTLEFLCSPNPAVGAPEETCRRVSRRPPSAMEMLGVATARRRRLQGASGMQMGVTDKDPLVAVRGFFSQRNQHMACAETCSFHLEQDVIPTERGSSLMCFSRGCMFLLTPSHRPGPSDHRHMP